MGRDASAGLGGLRIAWSWNGPDPRMAAAALAMKTPPVSILRMPTGKRRKGIVVSIIIIVVVVGVVVVAGARNAAATRPEPCYYPSILPGQELLQVAAVRWSPASQAWRRSSVIKESRVAGLAMKELSDPTGLEHSSSPGSRARAEAPVAH